VGGAPDDVLLRATTALRRMGARITRYDIEALTLEARIAGSLGASLVRVRAEEADASRTRLVVETEPPSVLGVFRSTASIARRLGRELSRVTITPGGRSQQR